MVNGLWLHTKFEELVGNGDSVQDARGQLSNSTEWHLIDPSHKIQLHWIKFSVMISSLTSDKKKKQDWGIAKNSPEYLGD